MKIHRVLVNLVPLKVLSGRILPLLFGRIKVRISLIPRPRLTHLVVGGDALEGRHFRTSTLIAHLILQGIIILWLLKIASFAKKVGIF